MATPSRIGTITISVDGAWDIEDLLALSEGLSESYGLFYPLVAKDDEVRARLQDLLRKQFWTGDIETRRFGRYLYRAVPDDEGLKIKSFHYSSPGALEIVGVLSVISMLAFVARSWIRAGDEFINLVTKIDGYFQKKKALRKPNRQFELGPEMAQDSDEARALVFKVGEQLGFGTQACETLIAIVGNPISTLKFLVAAANEGRKLASLEEAGLLELPPPPDQSVSIMKTGDSTRDGVRVVRKKSRRRPKRPP